MIPVGSLVDTDALWHAALYGLIGTLAVVGAFGLGVLAWDRSGGRLSLAGRDLPWALAMTMSALTCTAIVVLGIWAMTQK